MTCGECGREHVVTGQVLVDGVQVHPGLVEVMVEQGCKYGLLVRREPVGEAAMVEPDVPPRKTKSPTRSASGSGPSLAS